MNHAQVEELLAVYALDAVDPDEAAEIEKHLAECPHCRAEVAEHREMAALLNDSRAEVPPEMWEKLAAAISEPAEVTDLPQRAPLSRSDRYRARWRRLVLPYGSGVLGAAVAALVIVLALQVRHLNNEVHTMQAQSGLSSAVAAAVAGPHQDVTLASTGGAMNAHLIVGPDGNAYWVGSDLPALSSNKTYQVWASVHGKFVSVSVIGADPGQISVFRLNGPVLQLLVTVEPAGGVVAPTTTPVIQGAV